MEAGGAGNAGREGAPRGQAAIYLAWLNLRVLGLGGNPASFLLARAGIALNAGPGFSVGGTEHVRLNLQALARTEHREGAPDVAACAPI
ncbi:bifunctional pyridoxal-dependent enzyme with beta-cystathionase and maltose regulon repressor activities [Actinoplanes couchii]|nr:bifunctional pyridoxal-dependent enzyme with beta-cystathionase and maltose regulon repressor activities [Actinoplanes couchii]